MLGLIRLFPKGMRELARGAILTIFRGLFECHATLQTKYHILAHRMGLNDDSWIFTFF